MDEKSNPDPLSKSIPEAAGQSDEPGEEGSNEQNSLIAQSLKALAGGADDSAAAEVNEFLKGKGALIETTRASLVRGKSSAVDDLTKLLIEQFKLSPTIASVIAGLLVQILPSIDKKTPAKKKPRKKAKPKTTASTKKKPKKATAKKPKSSTSKTAKKKKSTSKAGKKKPAAKKAKPKKAKRSIK